jgi:hypothetical protein
MTVCRVVFSNVKGCVVGETEGLETHEITAEIAPVMMPCCGGADLGPMTLHTYLQSPSCLVFELLRWRGKDASCRST